jgi:pyruvate-formate lyase-activating enzyme
MSRVRITQIDGALPNVALMRLAHWHKAQGDSVHITRHIERDLFEDAQYDAVYGSCIFSFSRERLDRFLRQWPGAIVGGTGTGGAATIEQIIGDYEFYDYEGYDKFDASIGFTQRGCRLKCKFCVVPQKEGKNRSTGTIAQIWRGDPYPRHIHLLDNDFFGQPNYRAVVDEIREGGFKVCFSQGINTRLITDEAAQALATIKYSDTKFSRRRLYTAWDNLKDERIFFTGVERLAMAGIPPTNLMAYMLIGYDPLENWDRIWQRFNKMVALGIDPYPMVYNDKRQDLKCFQRWVITRTYKKTPWDEYRRQTKTEESTAAYVRTKEMEPA